MIDNTRIKICIKPPLIYLKYNVWLMAWCSWLCIVANFKFIVEGGLVGKGEYYLHKLHCQVEAKLIICFILNFRQFSINALATRFDWYKTNIVRTRLYALMLICYIFTSVEILNKRPRVIAMINWSWCCYGGIPQSWVNGSKARGKTFPSTLGLNLREQ